MMEVMGMKRYEMKYEATLLWPRRQTCNSIQLWSGCKKRVAGERDKIDGTIAFEKTENGWNVTI